MTNFGVACIVNDLNAADVVAAGSVRKSYGMKSMARARSALFVFIFRSVMLVSLHGNRYRHGSAREWSFARVFLSVNRGVVPS